MLEEILTFCSPAYIDVVNRVRVYELPTNLSDVKVYIRVQPFSKELEVHTGSKFLSVPLKGRGVLSFDFDSLDQICGHIESMVAQLNAADLFDPLF